MRTNGALVLESSGLYFVAEAALAVGWDPDEYPVSTAFGDRTISLPLGPALTDGDVERIIESVSAAL